MPLSIVNLLRTVTCFTLGAVCVWSCEEPVDLALEVPQSRLVISSSFIPDQPVVLQLSATQPRGADPVGAIMDARVTLFEGMDLAEELTYFPSPESDRPGTYRTTKFRPQSGHQYTIHVSAEGYDPVTAISTIPEAIGITSLAVTGMSVDQQESTAVYDYHLLVDYADPSDETNYYDLRILQMVVPFKVDSRGDTVRLQPYVKSVSTPVHETVNGQVVSLLLKDKPMTPVLDVHLQCRLDSKSELLGQIIAELRTVSPEYYFYQRSITRPDELLNSGLKDPVIIFNNVEKGLGVFAGYTSVSKELNLPGH